MKRRKFLQQGIAGGAAIVAAAVSSHAMVNTLAGAGNAGAVVYPEPPPEPFELEEATIEELQSGMHSGKFTAQSLVEKYLKRIDEVDRRGPAINSVIEVNPDALAIATELDRERKARGPRSPLHGIPILIKDNIDTADRMMTTAGSLALVGSRPARDAYVVKRLREAGAVILGKTNLSEWANFRSSRSSSGWSGRGGQTRNPYALDRNPCGSSSGSGAATAANLCAASIGTETDGSVVCPSSANSLVGIKPTLGLVSRSGIIPIAHSQDTAGPMARTVTDAAMLLSVIAGFDPTDPITKPRPGKSRGGYTGPPDLNALRGARVGVVRKSFGFNDQVDKIINEAVDVIKRLGAIIIDPANIATAGKFDDSELEVLLYEFKADLNKYLAALGARAPVHSLKEIIEFNESHRDREMPYFGQDLFIKAEAKGPLTEKRYLAALAKNHRLSRKEGIDLVMNQHRLDAMIAPTGGPSWTTDWANGDHFTGGYSSPSAVAGYPHITVPAGYAFGMPVGISFFGRANSERQLLRYAFVFEQATKTRRPPQFLPTAFPADTRS
ncbi:MAG: amidase [Pyrinomonadaceae bacterium]